MRRWRNRLLKGAGRSFSRINNDYKTAQRKEALEKAEYDRQLAFVTDQSSKEVGYNILKREVDANRDLYQSMLQKIKEASVLAALRASNIRIVDRAKPPALPYQPNVLIDEGIAILAGCMLSVLFVLIRERSDGSIRTAGETRPPAATSRTGDYSIGPAGHSHTNCFGCKPKVGCRWLLTRSFGGL